MSYEDGTYIVGTNDNKIVLVTYDNKIEYIIALIAFVILVMLSVLFKGSS